MSFFNRKSKNRRLGREYVLDVKLRSSQVRAARNRVAVMILGAVLAVAAGGYLAYRLGGWALDQLVYQNPAFAVTTIDLQTDGVLASEQLRAWAGVKPGQNLLALDLARVKRNLEIVPFVQSVAVERILPHTLRIGVTEREPIAQVYLPRPRPSGLLEPVAYNLDCQGYAMPPLDPRQRGLPANPAMEQLPLISGLKNAEVQPGRMLDVPQVRAALQLIQAFDRSQMAGVMDLKKIDAGAPDVLIATTSQGNDVTFGLVDMEQQLRRWHEIYEMGQRTSKAISSLDLAVTNNVPARWMEASAVPPTPPKLPRSFRTKRKHV